MYDPRIEVKSREETEINSLEECKTTLPSIPGSLIMVLISEQFIWYD
jgi:hypothetical protein